ncbi:MAG: sulfur carrier protein ThiS [Acidobacteriota bacterium]
MTDQIEIILNGTKQAVPIQWTLQDLVTETSPQPRGPVALELNGEIVKRRSWSEHRLKSGDEIELVHFVGGGET